MIWNVVMVFLAILQVVVIGKSDYAWSVGIPTVTSVGAGLVSVAYSYVLWKREQPPGEPTAR